MYTETKTVTEKNATGYGKESIKQKIRSQVRE